MQQDQPKRLVASDVPQFALDFFNKIDWAKLGDKDGRDKVAKLEQAAFTIGKIPKKKG